MINRNLQLLYVVVLNIREEGDIGLEITLVPKVLQQRYLIRWLKKINILSPNFLIIFYRRENLAFPIIENGNLSLSMVAFILNIVEVCYVLNFKHYLLSFGLNSPLILCDRKCNRYLFFLGNRDGWRILKRG